MNNFQKTLILGIVLLLVGANLTSLVGSNSLEKQTYVVTIDDNEPLDVRIIINGTEGKNGWFVSCVTITIIADDGGVLNIWYRLDGGYWKLYTMPFEVCEDGEHVIYAISFDPSGNQSNAQRDFKIDQTPPTTTAEFDGLMDENGWYISDVTVTLDAEDEPSGVDYTMCKLDDGEWTTYTDPFVVTEDGEHILYYYSGDIAGNVEDVNEANFKISPTGPPSWWTIHDFSGIMGDNDWYASDVTVTLTVIGVGADYVDYTMYKLDDGEWTEYTEPFKVCEDGVHNLWYYSVDKVGNKEDVKGPFGFNIDQTVPTIELTWDGDSSKLVADVSDGTSGVAKVEFYVNGEYVGEATESPYEWTVPNPKRGDEGQAIVYDNAGNEAISEKILAVPQGTLANSLYLLFLIWSMLNNQNL